MSDSKFLQITRTLLNIPANLNNVAVSMVLILFLFYFYFSLLCKPLETIPSVPITINITDTFIFHSIFSSLARSKYVSVYLLFFLFPSVVCWNGTIHEMSSSFCLVCWLCFIFRLGLSDLFVSENPRELYGSYFLRWFWFVYIPFISMVKFSSPAQFLVDQLYHPVMISFVLFFY